MAYAIWGSQFAPGFFAGTRSYFPFAKRNKPEVPPNQNAPLLSFNMARGKLKSHLPSIGTASVIECPFRIAKASPGRSGAAIATSKRPSLRLQKMTGLEPEAKRIEAKVSLSGSKVARYGDTFS